MFKLKSSYSATGDQPKAIEALTKSVCEGNAHQVLLGATGSGKTFTIANVIANTNRPTLVISHNKTLAAQLYQEFRDFFPQNAVEYFVSYYDYYQPESYVPQTDTYIEKDVDINEEIDKLRLSTTNSLLTRKDVIVVATVSCIYNLGSPVEYQKMSIQLKVGMKLRLPDLLKRLSQLNYERSDFDFPRGTFRVRGENVDINVPYQDLAIRLGILDDKLVSISNLEAVTGSVSGEPLDHLTIYPSKHYVTPLDTMESALSNIQKDLSLQLEKLKEGKKELEAYRLEQRTNYDLEMIRETGYCKGIENYSRYFDGRKPGEPPYTLIDFFPKDFLVVIDESHISVPQIKGMYNGDHSRKETLIEYGFRLPSALDNRPLRFEEFLRRAPQILYDSATPGEWELSMSRGNVAEQLLRPTGIPDPKIVVLPTKGQIEDLLGRIQERVSKKQRVLVTTLTKKMSEELSSYLLEKGVKAVYLHSDIETLERSDVLDNLRKGEYDVLVGINLLREGLDLPEVSLVAILDADKEGFLRSDTSLIQVMGRASRHVDGQVVMYADNVTGSMDRAISEVARRRKIQLEYNASHNLTPTGIIKPIRGRLVELVEEEVQKPPKLAEQDLAFLPPAELKKEIKRLEVEMKFEAESLNFEKAAIYRDEIKRIRKFL